MCTILVVEDENDFQKLICAHVQDIPFVTRVITSKTLSETLNILQKTTVDIILLDLNLPDSHGADTVEEIIIKFPESLILVMTGLTLDRELIDRLIIAGAFAFLNKIQLFQSVLSDWISQAWTHKKAGMLFGLR